MKAPQTRRFNLLTCGQKSQGIPYALQASCLVNLQLGVLLFSDVINDFSPIRQHPLRLRPYAWHAEQRSLPFLF